jgi:hypothetical protein
MEKNICIDFKNLSLLAVLDCWILKPPTYNKHTADALGKFSNSLVFCLLKVWIANADYTLVHVFNFTSVLQNAKIFD